MLALRRVFETAALLALLSIILFYLLHAAPGSPEDALIAQSAEMTNADLERLRSLRGLDRPIHERYYCWLTGHGDRGPEDRCAYWPSEGILSGDLGFSRVHKIAVREIVGARLGNTLSITIPAAISGAILALLIGLFAALRRGRTFDRVARGLALLGLSLPSHWLAMLCVLIFSLSLGWFPSSGAVDPRDPSFVSRIHHLLMPIGVLAFLYSCHWSRYARSAVIEALSQDHVKNARAAGLPEKTVLARHVLRNALLPLITVWSQSLPGLFAGVLVIETVFAHPGIGVLIVESVEGQDHLVAMVIFLCLAALTMFATLIADLFYTALDPRVRRT